MLTFSSLRIAASLPPPAHPPTPPSSRVKPGCACPVTGLSGDLLAGANVHMCVFPRRGGGRAGVVADVSNPPHISVHLWSDQSSHPLRLGSSCCCDSAAKMQPAQQAVRAGCSSAASLCFFQASSALSHNKSLLNVCAASFPQITQLQLHNSRINRSYF